ncbi:acetylglutamate kinase [Sinirhodobacter populi]|uniref:Acetylglutamate kinase n=2 Tax=Paenirhodobacter populi TaxID=2306993 RepID=A0A443KGS5_9RHOB|nr:acetylglutamate kinase [Sinirhodobacter populi]RWR14321.1 acetylglutamate kinase [Sinirhodobacter populi]RWR17712.1 acetylglutamate kinase [Sinirhodobacter populi]RWR31953.1 acetylglutamate kinase [Sinirhodobacter populi]RWR33705.1 acetylglutamate kinase [Sinirhodobacter populi]
MRKQTMDRDWTATARTLSEALPYLQRYTDAVVVVKFGGNAMGDDDAMAEFARDIVLMKQVGMNPVVVHGGGPMINDMLKKLGIQSQFVRGKRVTDKATVEVVEMILSGLVNKRIVQAINDQGGRAVGISGKDDDLMVCEADDPELGFVGRPVEMNVQVIRDLYSAGIIPVIAPVATGMKDNETFNVNGDTAAGAIAGALQADRLLLLTDVAGVKNKAGDVITQMSPDEVMALIEDGTISGGMIPKVETALQAVKEGVRAVVILDGRVPNACLLELFTEHGAGSMIRSTTPRVRPRRR